MKNNIIKYIGLLTIGTTVSNAAVLEEVMVTAQKRSQSANDIGMSIQAFSGDALEKNGISNASDLVQITPGLTYAKSPTNTPIFTLRGIGFNTSNLSSTSAVGLYVDEIAYAYPYMANGALFDMERVEVLKGPQGTLYGRNTTGGLVNFITNKPTEDFEGSLKVELGNFETTNFEGIVNVPVSDSLAFRLAGRVDQRGEGWQKSVTRDDKNGEKDTTALRTNISWQPSDQLDVLLSVSYWQDQSDSVAAQIIGANPDEPPFSEAAVLAVPLDRQWDNDTADWNEGEGPLGLGINTDSDFTSISNRIEYDLSETLSIVSLTGYNEVNRVDGNDFDGTDLNIWYIHSDGGIESFSQELRLVGESNRVKYILGAYYSKDEIFDNQIGHWAQSSGNNFLQFVAQNFIDPTNALYSAEQYANGFDFFRLNLESESIAKSVFGKLDYDATDALQLSLGLRYTEDELRSISCSADYEGNTLPVWNTAVWAGAGNTPPGNVVTNGCMTLTPDLSMIADPNREPLIEDNVSGRLTATYTPNNDWLLYGSVSRGFKSGAWPVLTAASSEQLNAATQEKVTAYEVGFKASVLDNAAQINAATFYYDYEDKQLLTEVSDVVFQTLPRLVNVPESKVYGAEIEITAQLSESVNALLAATYTKSKVDEYQGFRRLGNLDDFSGDEFPYTPELQFTGVLGYDTLLTSNLGFASTISASYKSEASAVIGREPGFDIDSYTLVNLDMSLYSNNDSWRVGIFAKNLFDVYYWTSVDVQTDAVSRIPGMPREFGARFQYSF